MPKSQAGPVLEAKDLNITPSPERCVSIKGRQAHSCHPGFWIFLMIWRSILFSRSSVFDLLLQLNKLCMANSTEMEKYIVACLA